MKTVFICPLTGYTFREEGNGILDIRKANGEWVIGLGKNTQAALAKHFRDKEDERLGRWRYNDHLVLYPGSKTGVWSNSPRSINVLDERDGRLRARNDHGTQEDEYMDAARAYFAAHPEPKPWHNAKEGEVWELTTDYPYLARGVYVAKVEGRCFQFEDGSWTALNSTGITAGKRVWGKD